jgi:hypothetical protein
MRRACAWCGAELGFRCPHCCEDLLPVEIVRQTASGRLIHFTGFICPRTDPPRVFEITAHTQTSHGICQKCAALTDDERDKLVRLSRRQIPGIPPATRALIDGELLANAEKRGPTLVAKSATSPAPTEAEKDAAAIHKATRPATDPAHEDIAEDDGVQ